MSRGNGKSRRYGSSPPVCGQPRKARARRPTGRDARATSSRRASTSGKSHSSCRGRDRRSRSSRRADAMSGISVLMTTEGTCPYGAGGVSTWCDALLRKTPDVRYTLLPIMMNPHIESKFDPPANVQGVINVPLWGIEEPAEFTVDAPFAELYERKRCTSDSQIQREFVPIFRRFLDFVNGGADPAGFGQVLVEMEDFFTVCDYNETMKSRPVWRAFCEVVQASARGTAEALPEAARIHQQPTLFDLTESLRWLYRFLIVLTVAPPEVDVTHTTAAAFCGIPCITAKVRYGTPMIVTEHGVYLREQNLFLSRFRRLFFCKQFLLNLITAVVRANYFHADVVAPVCHYNTRWEVAHDTPQRKIHVIHNGVDPDVWTPDSPAWPGREVELVQGSRTRSSGGFQIVTTARIDPLKDLETLLRIAARVRETHPGVRFSIYGAVADEAYYRRVVALRAHLQLDDTVQVPGPAGDLLRVYRPG